MPFLTKMEIDHETAGMNMLFDHYAWHKAAWACFPDMPDAKRNFLTRLDASLNGFRLFILSDKAPKKPEWCPDSEDSWMPKEIPSEFLDQRYYRFDLLANPTKKIKKEVNGVFTKNGKRVVLTKPEEQQAWLFRKAETAGFMVCNEPSLAVSPAVNYHFIKKAGQIEPGLHVGVRYSGLLEVKNRELFHKAYFEGIGSAKGFGFGLLLLKPVVL